MEQIIAAPKKKVIGTPMEFDALCAYLKQRGASPLIPEPTKEVPRPFVYVFQPAIRCINAHAPYALPTLLSLHAEPVEITSGSYHPRGRILHYKGRTDFLAITTPGERVYRTGISLNADKIRKGKIEEGRCFHLPNNLARAFVYDFPIE